jgi:glycosyltransferase involved in cell wall biosynthesis
VDEHNIESQLLRRMGEGERSLLRRGFNRWEHRRYRRFERSHWACADGCLVTSSREEPVIRDAAPDTPTMVVPNGVDLDYFAPDGRAVSPRTVVFNGVFDYRPNLDAAHWLVEEVWPLVTVRCPDAVLTLVGRGCEADFRRLVRPGVVITGEVPDVRPHLAGAAATAVPVRIGGGTRLKVVEGLAMAKPMVTTSLGCEGIAVRAGEHLLIAEDPSAFAAAILRLFADPALGARLGEAGRRLAEREYSWASAGERMEALYREVTGPARERPGPGTGAVPVAVGDQATPEVTAPGIRSLLGHD